MACWLLSGWSHPGSAAEPSAASARPPWREISAGAETTSSYWSAYSTSTFALFGGLDEDGWRLRTSGGYGRYHYTGAASRAFKGETSFADVLAGYQARLGGVTVKAFAGGSGIAHRVLPLDPGNEVQGLDLGFKAALEVWANIGDQAWTSADLSWSSAFGTYTTRLRGGWRMTPELSIGLEGGAVGNAAYDGGRAGAFVRYAPSWGEISLTAGLSGDIDKPDHPFAMLNWQLRY